MPSDASLTPCPVRGVQLATVEAGIRYPDRRDLVALVFDPGTNAAAMFTRNAFCAAPVIVAREHLAASGRQPRVFLINTGNANAGTGESGLAAARHCCLALGEVFGVDATEVLPFSTGVIGEDLPVERLEAALPALHGALRDDGWEAAAWGILTTDTRPKLTSREFEVDGVTCTLTGMAKGAGMLRPDMATMLVFIATDIAAKPEVLDTLLRRAVEGTFHRITVDGDTSTNDAIVLAATGAAEGTGPEPYGDADAPALRPFYEALHSLCLELAQGLVRDGEGVTKLVELAVTGGRTQAECLDVAFTIAHSPLVKTALFAADPNWGRLLAAIGRAGIEDLDVEGVRILIDDLPIAEKGARAAAYDEAKVAEVMQRDAFRIRVDLQRGDAAETVWTSDFSYDYVRINAEYRS